MTTDVSRPPEGAGEGEESRKAGSSKVVVSFEIDLGLASDVTTAAHLANPEVVRDIVYHAIKEYALRRNPPEGWVRGQYQGERTRRWVEQAVARIAIRVKAAIVMCKTIRKTIQVTVKEE